VTVDAVKVEGRSGVPESMCAFKRGNDRSILFRLRRRLIGQALFGSVRSRRMKRRNVCQTFDASEVQSCLSSVSRGVISEHNKLNIRTEI